MQNQLQQPFVPQAAHRAPKSTQTIPSSSSKCSYRLRVGLQVDFALLLGTEFGVRIRFSHGQWYAEHSGNVATCRTVVSLRNRSCVVHFSSSSQTIRFAAVIVDRTTATGRWSRAWGGRWGSFIRLRTLVQRSRSKGTLTQSMALITFRLWIELVGFAWSYAEPMHRNVPDGC